MMKASHIVFLCVGCIIGWGAFILPGDMFLSKMGLFESIIGLGLGAAAICIIAMQYTFLLARYRHTGGEFYFTLKVLGRTHGFICGWFLSLAYLCIIPLNATALGIMSHSFGFSFPHIAYHINGSAVYTFDLMMSICSILCIAICNILGIKIAFFVQKILTLCLVGSVVVFFAIMSVDSISWTHFASYLHKDISISHIMIVFALAPWAYLGFDCGVQIIQSIHYVRHIFDKLTYCSIWIGFMLYAGLICITAFGIDKPHITQTYWATYESINGYFGTFGSAILCVGILSALFSGINGFFITTSKVFEALSTASLLPTSLLKTNRFNVSYRILTIIALLACVMSCFGRQSLLYIVDMACVGIIVGFLYVSIISLLIKARHHKVASLSALLSLGLSILFLSLTFLPFSPAVLKPPSLVALGIWCAMGIAVFAYLKQR